MLVQVKAGACKMLQQTAGWCLTILQSRMGKVFISPVNEESNEGLKPPDLLLSQIADRVSFWDA